MRSNGIFCLNTFIDTNIEAFHLDRITISSNCGLQFHEHNYPEIFWVREGIGFHLINGEEIPLSKGMLWVIRPSDKHTFYALGNSSLVITNMAFKNRDLDYFKQRYFPNQDDLFWKTGEIPFHIQLKQDQLNELSVICDYLLVEPKNNLNLDSILLHIFRMLAPQNNNQINNIPHWLKFAIENYNSPDQFREGVNGFVSLTNCSADHVNRILKQKMKQTLTETVNKIKLKYAAHQLTMTNMPIKTICYNCGFETLGYYYKIFKANYGITPKEYRQQMVKVY